MDHSLANVVYAIGRVTSAGINLLGTGFAVAPNKIATTAHVATADDRGLVLVMPKILSLYDYQDTTDIQVNPLPLTIAAFDPISDIAILTGDIQTRFGWTFGGSDQVPPGTVVASLGFPHADSGRLVMTQHISSVWARIMLGASGAKNKHIVLNTQTRPGQSGSPVFFDDGKQVCAMIIGSYAPHAGGGATFNGIDPAILHQTTHAISAEYIQAML
jgi:hypothetical protein